jgi:EmrB/QacA subfamily drug resistance transporter
VVNHFTVREKDGAHSMEQQPIDYSRKWYVMAAVAMGIFLATIDGSIVNIALPTLVRELHTDFAIVQWVVLAYLITVTTLMLSVGRLADMVGKKTLYTSGFVVFTIGSLLCGLAPTVGWLIGFRVLQAIGAAMTMALSAAIVTEAFPPSQRGKAMGITGAVVSIGIVLGPALGGLVIAALSWHWIFFVNLPVGLVGTLMVLRFVPAIRPSGSQRFDYLGAVTLFVSLISLLLALTLGQQAGFATLPVLLLFASWALFLAAFIRVEWKSRQPMLDLRLFQNSLFSINLITGFITFVAIAGTMVLMPFYLENMLRYDTVTVGLLLAVVPIGLGVVSPISGGLSDRFGTRSISVIGLVALLIGYSAVSTLGLHTTLLGYVLRFLPLGIGMGLFQSPNNSAIMGATARERLGVASGLLSISRTLGQTVGVAALGAVWASRVEYYAGIAVQGDGAAAPVAAQVAALQDTVLVIVAMIVLALVLSVWGVMHERQVQDMAVLGANPSEGS